MTTDLMADKERSDARYDAARSITKRLAKLPDPDRLVVLRHVATEMGFSLVEDAVFANGKPAPAPPPKAA